MSTITFDTLKYANTLKAGGVPTAQAEAEAVALSEVLEVNFKDLVTKQDLLATKQDLELTLEKSISPLRQELAVLKWMLGIIAAGILALVLKAFFL